MSCALVLSGHCTRDVQANMSARPSHMFRFSLLISMCTQRVGIEFGPHDAHTSGLNAINFKPKLFLGKFPVGVEVRVNHQWPHV